MGQETRLTARGTRRRGRPRRLARLVAATVLLVGAAACGDDGDDDAVSDEPDATDSSLRVAMLMPGRANDNSFNQSGAVSLERAVEADGDVEFTILEEIVDPTDSQPAISQFARDGYDLIIGHGIEYVEPIVEVAEDFPDTAFMTAAAVSMGVDPTDNINDWVYDFVGMGYPLGVAGAYASETGQLGIVGGPELDFVGVMHDAFRSGAESVDPDVSIDELYTGSFEDVQAASEAASNLVAGGADVLYCSGDGICEGVATVASQEGAVLLTGFGDLRRAAGDVALTAVVLELEDLYLEFFDLVRSDDWGNGFFVSDLANGQEAVTPVNLDVATSLAVSPEEIQAELDDLLEQIREGELELNE